MAMKTGKVWTFNKNLAYLGYFDASLHRPPNSKG